MPLGHHDHRASVDDGGISGHHTAVPPESFDEALRHDWDEWVLDHGMPGLLPEPAPGESIPIARWAGAQFGAVVHVASHGATPGADDEGGLVSEVQVYRRTGGSWEPSSGSGGTDWFDPPLSRPAEIGPREVAILHMHSSGDDDWSCCAVVGIAGLDAARVELHDAAGATAFPVESRFGAFIVCWNADEAVRVRVLDGDGQSMFDERYVEG
jgi:hypothetical protein